MSAPRSHGLALGLAAVLPLVVTLGLTWPLVLDLGGSHPLTPFGDSHVWVYERIAQALGAGELPGQTCAAGFPETRSFRAIGWGPGLMVLFLRPLLGVHAAAWVAQLAALPLSAVAAWLLLGRWTGADPWTRAFLGAAWSLSPTLLATFGTGEISNTAAWVLPLFLYLAAGALGQGGPLRWAGLGLLCLIAAFTSPYYALALPILAGLLALARVIKAGRERSAWVGAGVLLVVVAASLAPAAPYYKTSESAGGESVFQPALRARQVHATVPHPSPVAQPLALLTGPQRSAGSAFEPVHNSYVGLVLLVAGLGGAVLGRRRGWGLALGGTGLVLALGPHLNLGGQVLFVGEHPVPLPVAMLEWLGYPTADGGGLYYRYTVLLSLGLVVLAAAGLAGRKRAPLWAALVASLATADSIRATGPFWPRPVEPIVGAPAMRALAGGEGAVLELPLQGPMDAHLGQGALLRAVLHQRPTTGLPRDVMRPRHPLQGALDFVLQAPEPQGAREHLQAQGFGAAVFPLALVGKVRPDLPELEQALGPAERSDGLAVWTLGAASSACRPTPP